MRKILASVGLLGVRGEEWRGPGLGQWATSGHRAGGSSDRQALFPRLGPWVHPFANSRG